METNLGDLYKRSMPKETVIGAEEVLCLEKIKQINMDIAYLEVERKEWNRRLNTLVKKRGG